MSFSAKRCAYCPRPSVLSQSAICCMAAPTVSVRPKRTLETTETISLSFVDGTYGRWDVCWPLDTAELAQPDQRTPRSYDPPLDRGSGSKVAERAECHPVRNADHRACAA